MAGTAGRQATCLPRQNVSKRVQSERYALTVFSALAQCILAVRQDQRNLTRLLARTHRQA